MTRGRSRSSGCRGGRVKDEIKASVKERADGGEIPKFAVPDRIQFVEEIDKKTLREKYAE